MRFTKFQIENYKSFWTNEAFELGAGINVIAGQNACGKTALLEGMSLKFNWAPHKSTETVPSIEKQPQEPTRAMFSFQASQTEIRDLVDQGGLQFRLPLPARNDNLTQELRRTSGIGPITEALFSWFLDQKALTFSVQLETGGTGEKWSITQNPSFGCYQVDPLRNQQETYQTLLFQGGRNLTLQDVPEQNLNDGSDVGIVFAHNFRGRIYRFAAQRIIKGRAIFGNNSTLTPTGENLAEVINFLSSNPHHFDLYNSLVCRIFPQIRRVTTMPLPNNQLEIRIWTISPESRRPDLAIPLDETGTGIGQVLAILYVVTTATKPQVILIDEPQSFLHPGAAKKLVEVLVDYPEHQYVITTHSPSLISASRSESIISLRLDGPRTMTTRFSAYETRSMRSLLAEVGVSLSEVFGADRILWVEGETEALCFQTLFKLIDPSLRIGTQVLPLRSTGDIIGKDARRVIDIYRRLSNGIFLIPSAAAFVLDRECFTKQQADDLVRESSGKVHFLPRRMFENNLLIPEAIAWLVNAIEGFAEREILADDITHEFQKRIADRAFYCKNSPTDVFQAWEHNIDGARLLQEVFVALSEDRCRYEKIKHGDQLTTWILQERGNSFKELSSMLEDCLKSATD